MFKKVGESAGAFIQRLRSEKVKLQVGLLFAAENDKVEMKKEVALLAHRIKLLTELTEVNNDKKEC